MFVMKKLIHCIIMILMAGLLISGNPFVPQNKITLALQEQAVFITRDYHFTNPIRFPAERTQGIIYIRHGNLESEEEIAMVEKCLSDHDLGTFRGKLVTLYRDSIRIR